jgi:hypothetical protein
MKSVPPGSSRIGVMMPTNTRRAAAHARVAFLRLIAGAAILASTLPARADVTVVDGKTSGTIVVTARQATIQEVLEALGRSQKFEFRSAANLSRVVTGTYSGSLQRVLARVLDGYDTVIQSSPSGLKLNVIGVASASGVPAAAIAGAPAPRVSTNVDLDDEAAAKRARTAPAAAPAPAPAKSAPPSAPAAAPVAASVAPSHPTMSSNVDLDEEKLGVSAAPAYPAPSAAMPAALHTAGFAGTAAVPSHPAVSSNVDLDEETSVRGGATR